MSNQQHIFVFNERQPGERKFIVTVKAFTTDKKNWDTSLHEITKGARTPDVGFKIPANSDAEAIGFAKDNMRLKLNTENGSVGKAKHTNKDTGTD